MSDTDFGSIDFGSIEGESLIYVRIEMQEYKYKRIKHTFLPIYDKDSKILILGSFPSVKSRENGFYYGHPQNRFWKVLGGIFENDTDSLHKSTIEEKINFLKKYHIALWDVINECDIIGSSDSSIRNVIPSDIKSIIKESRIEKIFVNGKMAKKLYDKYCFKEVEKECVLLPSTSPANAVYRLEDLIKLWKEIK